MTAMLSPHVAVNNTLAGGSVWASVTRKLLLSTVGVHVTLEVVVGVGAIGAVGAGVRLLTCVSVHMSL